MVIEHALFIQENTVKEGKQPEILDIFITWLLQNINENGHIQVISGSWHEGGQFWIDGGLNSTCSPMLMVETSVEN